MNRTYKYFPALFGIILFIAAPSCRTKQHKPAARQPVKIAVKTAPVTVGNIRDTVYIYGEIKLRHEVLLASQFDGRLTDFSLLVGDRVRKGQQAGIIIPPLREALLHVMGQVPAAQRKTLSEEIKEIPLLSPAGGIVLAVFHRSGDVVKKGEAIARIANLKQLDVYADLPVQYMPTVKKLKSMHLQFINYPHKPLVLPVSAFAGIVRPATQTLRIRLALSNPGEQFRPGMQVKLWFPATEHRHTYLIPRPALLEQEGVFYVFVIQNGIARKRKVTVGIRQSRYVEILSGLHAGEKVVTDKAYSLTDGVAVEINQNTVN